MSGCRTILMTLTFLAMAWCAGDAAAIDRTPIDAAFRRDLDQLAAKCVELQLPEQAAATQAWFLDRLPDRQYLFIPPDRGPTLPATTTELVRKWHDKFLEVRRAQAARLMTLAEEYLAADDPTRAYQALHEVLREDPDHARARAILGFRLADGIWRVPGASTGVRKVSVAHSYLKDFKAGSYWRVTTPHFQVTTTAGAAAGQQFGEQLEMLDCAWRQAFFRYWSSQDELAARFARPTVATKPKKPFDVVLFKSREEYLANLSAAEPRLAVTQGFYSDQKATAFLYIGDDRSTATCNHEVTHQLFQESGDVAREVGASHDFWIVEGIALYMESLRTFERQGRLDHVTLGGWDADRLQFARHHVFNGQYQMPLEELTALGREGLQASPQIKRLYSQSAGLAHYFMDGRDGQFREATISYLAGLYAGRAQRDALTRLTKTSLAEHDAGYKDFLRVSDQQLAQIDAPESVRNLCLGYQAITDAGVKHLAACKNLRWLDLAAVEVTDAGLAHLRDLRMLDQLNLERTSAGDATLAWLGQHPQLRELDLSQMRITDDGLKQLAALTNLEVLWLTGTRISDASLPLLKRFRKLTTLELEGTQISPTGQQQLRSALPHLTDN